MENASRAFLDAVGKPMRQIRKTLGTTRVNPKLLTAAERLQYEGYLRRSITGSALSNIACSRSLSASATLEWASTRATVGTGGW
ncbi:hypothetical protein I6F11_29550 [Ensifer sp. NBAIM29]|nr:hypothetical protein [Ensifer sp. NBAIM29]